MNPLALLACLAAGPADRVFDAAVAAHSSLRSASATLSVEDRGIGYIRSQSVELVFVRPHAARFRLKQSPSGSVPSLDRTYFIRANQAISVDHTSGQFLERKAEPSLTLASRMAYLAEVPDGVRYLVDSGEFKALVGLLRKGTAFKVVSTGSEDVLTRGSKQNAIEIRFDRRTHQLSMLKVGSGSVSNRFSVKYGAAPATVSAPSTAGLKKVAELRTPIVRPTYATGATRQLAEKLWSRYGGLKSVAYRVSSPDGAVSVWFGGGRSRYQSRTWEWAHDGAAIHIASHADRAYWEAKSNPANTLYRLSTVKAPTDPFLRELLAGENPLRTFYTPQSRFKLTGSFGRKGANVDIVEIRQSSVKITLEVRRETGLIERATSEHLDGSGRPLDRLVREYSYSAVGKNLDAATFQLNIPAGYRKRKFGG